MQTLWIVQRLDSIHYTVFVLLIILGIVWTVQAITGFQFSQFDEMKEDKLIEILKEHNKLIKTHLNMFIILTVVIVILLLVHMLVPTTSEGLILIKQCSEVLK